MRADGVDSANAGAIPELKPPAFQIIVLVCMEGYTPGTTTMRDGCVETRPARLL